MPDSNINFIIINTHTSFFKRQSMFIIRLKKMQKARCLRSLFSLTLAVLLGNWLVINVNAHSKFANYWKKSLSKPTQTRRTASGSLITYRLDTWSQYDNPEEGAQREGDIHESSQSSRKSITRDKTLLWSNGVINYYVHSSIVNEPSKFIILENALDIIMSKTCIKFVRIQDYEELPKNNWVNITGHKKGCFSDLGRNIYGPTALNLDVNTCFSTIGHTMHEMLHTLGVYHEHMRPDRDQYITILWENIKKGNAFNFQILNTSVVTDYGLPYDYESIMHYSMTSFSINKSIPTIIPMTTSVEIGQRSYLSYYDIQKLLITYNCTSNDIENKSKNTRGSKLQQQNKPIHKIKVKPQLRMSTTRFPKSDVSNKNTYAKSRRSMDGFNQVTFPKFAYFTQPDNYPVPLNPVYINFHFYFHKK